MTRFLPYLLILLFIIGISSPVEAATKFFIQPFTGADALKADLGDVECLALNIYHEARGESELGQKYVAQVSMNRMRHYAYGDSMCDVVFKRRQFSWTHDGKSDAVKDIDAWDEAIDIAIDFYHLGKTIPDDNAEHYLWYYNPTWADPDWAEGKIFKKIGNHLFLTNYRATMGT